MPHPSLLSPILPWAMIAITALLFIAAVVLLPRVARSKRTRGLRRLKPYVLQAGALILVPVLVIATVFLFVNRNYEWYSSWRDLAGVEDPGGAPQQQFGNQASAEPASHEIAPDPQPSALQKAIRDNPTIGRQVRDADPAELRANGLYATFELAGQTTGLTRKMQVWLPPAYFEDDTSFFPVFLGFIGFPSGVGAYQKEVEVGKMIMGLNKAGKLRQSIVVVPETFTGNYDSECVDATQGKGAQPIESWVTKDVTGWVKENLRARPDAASWATMGYSAGGWCSSMMTIKHPDLYTHSLNLSGYFEPWYSDGQFWRPKDDTSYDLGKIVQEKKPAVDIWYYSGGDDRNPIASMKKFAPKVQSPTSLTTQVLPSGGHRMTVWRPGFELGMERLGQISEVYKVGGAAASASPSAASAESTPWTGGKSDAQKHGAPGPTGGGEGRTSGQSAGGAKPDAGAEAPRGERRN